MVSRQGTKNFRKLWIFGSGHFLIYFLRYYGSKNDRIQKIFFIQKSVFSCLLTRRNDFWNPFILRSYFHNCLPGLLTHIANQLSLLTKKYLTSKVHFDIIYLKITENARSVTTENTLMHKYSCAYLRKIVKVIFSHFFNCYFIQYNCILFQLLKWPPIIFSKKC